VKTIIHDSKIKFIIPQFIFIILLIHTPSQLLSNNNFINNNSNIICGYCTKSINGKYLNHEGKNYHKDCYQDNIQLRCDFCTKTISGIYNIDDNKTYHTTCYRNNILAKCDACNTPLDSEFILDNWGYKYHIFHMKETPNCESCNRLICEAITNGGYLINDNRNICSICWEQSINENTSNIDLIVSEVKSRLAMVGINQFPDNIPITLVNTKRELEQISDISIDEVNGYTRYGVKSIGGIKISEEYEIFILSNLHKMIFKAVLAHELMHVYLFQNNINLSSQKTEGFCNLGAKLIYEDYNNQFSKIKLKAMYQNKDIDYGKGFLIMDVILKEKGWDRLLSELGK